MTISLMRDGNPAFAERGWVTPAQITQWIRQYNLSEAGPLDILAESLLPLKSAAVLATSTSPRSMTSTQLSGRLPDVSDPLFCEAELPFAPTHFPKLPPIVWATIFRVCWFLGYARGVESVHCTKLLAHAAAKKLVALHQQGSVLLVGHGIMNRLIAKELSAMGWHGKHLAETFGA